MNDVVWYCEEHRCSPHPLDDDQSTCPLWSWEMEHRPTPVPCRMVRKGLTDLQGEK